MSHTTSHQHEAGVHGAAGRLRSKRMILLVGVPLIAGLVFGVVYLKGGRYVGTDNAYVRAVKVPVSPEVSGMVKEVLVAENQTVVAGQPLFRLDSAPFEIAVARAEARLAQVGNDLAAAKASYREKQGEIALARTRYEFALKNQNRQASLVAKNFISAAGYDDARQNAELASQQVATLEQDLKRIADSLGGEVNAPVTRMPAYREALAALDQARLDLTHVEVRASLSGVVSKLPKPGQFVAAGNMALVLVGNGDLWVEANFTETDLTYVQPGQPVSIRVDTYPDQRWKGVVESLSPATGSEFSVIPAQNATGNWVKITQRVPVRIRFDAAAATSALRVGMSSEVEIDTGHRRKLLGLAL